MPLKPILNSMNNSDHIEPEKEIQGIGQYMPNNEPLTPPVPFSQSSTPSSEIQEQMNSDFSDAMRIIDVIKSQYNEKMVGQDSLRETLLIGLISGGHILIESVPGLAKTTAAHTLSNTVKGKFSRIQCTPDLLPSDILGIEIYNQKTGDFKTELGPVHANFVLMDEINRSSAKTQSAMLEAMQEKQTTIAGSLYKLPEPFMVIATQNPIEQEGTYSLPEAQLDRFMLKEILTYPSSDEEFTMLERYENGILNQNELNTNVNIEDILKVQKMARKIYVEPTIKEYIINLVTATRNTDLFIEKGKELVEYGASPRASIAFLDAVRALALINGRNHALPEDVKEVAVRVLRHRIILSYKAELNNITSETIVTALLDAIPVP